MNNKTYAPIQPRTVAFLGLGVMGYPMAGHLARAGHRVCAFNRTAAKAQAWAAEYGGKAAATPREAAAGASIVFACVGNDDDLRSVVLGADGAFAEKAGLDAERVLDVISKGAAQSWQMENRGKTMHARKFDFGFAVDWMRKDLGLVLDEARRNGAKLPVTALVDQFYADVQGLGGRRWDTSSLIKRLK